MRNLRERTENNIPMEDGYTLETYILNENGVDCNIEMEYVVWNGKYFIIRDGHQKIKSLIDRVPVRDGNGKLCMHLIYDNGIITKYETL